MTQNCTKYNWYYLHYVCFIFIYIYIYTHTHTHTQTRRSQSAARSKAWVCCSSLAGIVGLNPAGGMDVCCECCVLSRRGLYDEVITRKNYTYTLQRTKSRSGTKIHQFELFTDSNAACTENHINVLYWRNAHISVLQLVVHLVSYRIPTE